MSTRLQNEIAKSNEDALAAFVSKKAEIDSDEPARLQAPSESQAVTRLRAFSPAFSSQLCPSPFSIACSLVQSCQRWTTTSQYRGSSSTRLACRPAFSQAISVKPEPPKGSSAMSRLFSLELRYRPLD